MAGQEEKPGSYGGWLQKTPISSVSVMEFYKHPFSSTKRWASWNFCGHSALDWNILPQFPQLCYRVGVRLHVCAHMCACMLAHLQVCTHMYTCE